MKGHKQMQREIQGLEKDLEKPIESSVRIRQTVGVESGSVKESSKKIDTYESTANA